MRLWSRPALIHRELDLAWCSLWRLVSIACSSQDSSCKLCATCCIRWSDNLKSPYGPFKKRISSQCPSKSPQVQISQTCTWNVFEVLRMKKLLNLTVCLQLIGLQALSHDPHNTTSQPIQLRSRVGIAINWHTLTGTATNWPALNEIGDTDWSLGIAFSYQAEAFFWEAFRLAANSGSFS